MGTVWGDDGPFVPTSARVDQALDSLERSISSDRQEADVTLGCRLPGTSDPRHELTLGLSVSACVVDQCSDVVVAELSDGTLLVFGRPAPENQAYRSGLPDRIDGVEL
jgi:hypothetical protein